MRNLCFLEGHSPQILRDWRLFMPMRRPGQRSSAKADQQLSSIDIVDMQPSKPQNVLCTLSICLALDTHVPIARISTAAEAI